MKRVRIREHSIVARLAARNLKFRQVAIVIGSTIFLHNISTEQFIKSKRWVIHELKHVEQFQTFGILRFLWLYLLEYSKKGYWNNKFEIEARNSEGDESLLLKYDLSEYMR
jgi:hypothetical protein